MIMQYLKLKETQQDAILMFRLGDFYEMFFNDAHVASKALDIVLTGRDAGSNEKVPMCGVPHHSVDSYIKRLIDQGYKVALAEQTEEATGKKLVQRDVVKVITPGTHMDETTLGDKTIAALSMSDYYAVIAYLNPLTGELFSQKTATDIPSLISALEMMNVKEILLKPGLDDAYKKAFENAQIFMSLIFQDLNDNDFDYLLEALNTPLEIKTASRLIHYLKTTQNHALLTLKPVRLLTKNDVLYLDGNTIRHLELLKNERHQTVKGSLFSLINYTHTPMGHRFLKQQLLRPLKDQGLIENRLDMIEAFNTEFLIKDQMESHLKKMADLEKITTKIASHSVLPKDLYQLKETLYETTHIKELLKSLNTKRSQEIIALMPDLNELAMRLDNALLEDFKPTIHEGYIFKETYHEALKAFRNLLEKGDEIIRELEKTYQDKTGIKKLKIRKNSVFGYYIEVPKAQAAPLEEDINYTRKQTLANAERFITEDLKNHEKTVFEASDKMIKLEKELYQSFTESLLKETKAINQMATLISEIDYYQSLSKASIIHQFTRPLFHDKKTVSITGSFHPVIKALRPEIDFVENDITYDETTDILLITGPNMSGKSTYMRQFALTVVLAQMGSFVPSREALLPLFDQIFTRIGASDDLISGESTFMVEMLEAKRALDQATESSLILFDEMGRGTSTYDGMALAWAMLEYMHETIQAKTMFSTHYHELVKLSETLSKLKNIHVSAVKENDVMHFLHQVKEGPSSDSFGIEVAALAGIHSSIIKRAALLLKTFEKNQTTVQMNLFDVMPEKPDVSQLEKRLKALDLDDLKPLDALMLLYEWKKKLWES